MALNITNKSPMQILNELCVKLGIQPVITTTSDIGLGQRTVPMFISRCELNYGGKLLSAAATGKRKKDAEQSACEKMLKEHLGILQETNDSILVAVVNPQLIQKPSQSNNVGVNDNRSLLTERTIVLDDDDVVLEATSGDTIVRLKSFCVRRSMGEPVFLNEPVIRSFNKDIHVVRCKVGDIEEVGTSFVKKTSEKISAFKVLAKLSIALLAGSTPNPSSSGPSPSSSGPSSTSSSPGLRSSGPGLNSGIPGPSTGCPGPSTSSNQPKRYSAPSERAIINSLAQKLATDIPSATVSQQNSTKVKVVEEKGMEHLLSPHQLVVDKSEIVAEATEGNKIDELMFFCNKESLGQPSYMDGPTFRPGPLNKMMHVMWCQVGELKEVGVCLVNKKVSKKIAAYKMLNRLQRLSKNTPAHAHNQPGPSCHCVAPESELQIPMEVEKESAVAKDTLVPQKPTSIKESISVASVDIADHEPQNDFILDNESMIFEAMIGNTVDDLKKESIKQCLGEPVYTDEQRGPSNMPVHIVKCKVGDIEDKGVCIVSKKASKKIAAFKVLNELKKSASKRRHSDIMEPSVCSSDFKVARSEDENEIIDCKISYADSGTIKTQENATDHKEKLEVDDVDELSTNIPFHNSIVATNSKIGQELASCSSAENLFKLGSGIEHIPQNFKPLFGNNHSRGDGETKMSNIGEAREMVTQIQKEIADFPVGPLLQKLIDATKIARKKNSNPKPIKEIKEWLIVHERCKPETFFLKLKAEMKFKFTISPKGKGEMVYLSLQLPTVYSRIPTFIGFGASQAEATEKAYMEMLTYFGVMYASGK